MNFLKRLFKKQQSENVIEKDSENSSTAVDLNTAQMMESNAETISYSNGPLEPFYEQMSKELIDRHGKLVAVDYLSHYPKFEIYFAYEDGMRIYSGQRTGEYDIHFLSLGYVGEGPRYVKHFLSAAGFDLSHDQIKSVEPGDSILLKDGVARIQKKSEKANEEGLGKVKFSHERNEEVFGAPATYRHYTAPDKESAESFLEKQNITAQSYFIVVETPEGIFAKDRMGTFEQ